MNSAPNVVFPIAGLMGLAFSFVCCVLVVYVAIHVVICYLVYNCYLGVPPEHRKQSPGLVWLMLIPLFGAAWNFFVYPKLSESFASYFAAKGRTDKGDCDRGLAMAYCICSACAFVPYAGGLAGLAALVLLIIYLVRAYDHKALVAQIESRPQVLVSPPVPPSPGPPPVA